jgi:hypothetical protein
MFQLGDGIDVVLPRIPSSAAWISIGQGLAPIVARIFSLVLFDDEEADVVQLRRGVSEFLNGSQELLLERMTS